MHYQARSVAAPTRLSEQLQIAHERPVIVHPRMAWILYYQEKKNVRLVCQKFGISRKTFYKWLKRYNKSGGDATSLRDNSRKPHRFPRATPKEVVQQIVEAKKETGFGQRRLKQYLAEKHNISVSEHTIWKLLKRVTTDSRFSMSGADPSTAVVEPRPGELVQIGVKDITMYLNHYQYVQFTALDTCTKLRISKIYRRLSWRSAADFVKFAIEKFPFPIKEIQTPSEGAFMNGSSSSDISAILFEPVPVLAQKNNIKQTLVASGNGGKLPVDKLHDIDDEEFFKRNSHRKPEDLIRTATEYVTLYNNHRKHEDLSGLTPLQKLRSFSDFKNIVYFDPYS
jgi:transposase